MPMTLMSPPPCEDTGTGPLPESAKRDKAAAGNAAGEEADAHGCRFSTFEPCTYVYLPFVWSSPVALSSHAASSSHRQDGGIIIVPVSAPLPPALAPNPFLPSH